MQPTGAEHPLVGEREQPERRELSGDDRGREVVQPGTEQERKGGHVDPETARTDKRELREAACERAEAQSDELREVDHSLADGSLAFTGVALAELEGDVGHLELGAPGHDLEQNLEPSRLQVVGPARLRAARERSR